MKILRISKEGSEFISLDEFDPTRTVDNLFWIYHIGNLEMAEEWLSQCLKLDTHSVAALCEDSTRPRAFMNDQNDLVAIIRGLKREEENLPDLVSLRILMQKNILFTLGNKHISVVQRLFENGTKSSARYNSTQQILWKICSLVVEDIADSMRDLEEAIQQVEDWWESEHSLDNEKLHQNRMFIAHAKRYLVPQQDIFHRMEQLLIETFTETKERKLMHFRWREIIYLAKRDNEALFGAHERINILKDSAQQNNAQRLNRIMYSLTLVATFFLPLTFISSLLGMNVGGIPAQNQPYAFMVVCLGLAAIFLVQLFIFKRLNWFK